MLGDTSSGRSSKKLNMSFTHYKMAVLEDTKMKAHLVKRPQKLLNIKLHICVMSYYSTGKTNLSQIGNKLKKKKSQRYKSSAYKVKLADKNQKAAKDSEQKQRENKAICMLEWS